MTQTTHLTAEGVYCRFGNRELFDGLSLTIESGQAIELRGPNGSGKSTLLRILAGLQQPDAGKVVHTSEGIGFIGHKAGVTGLLTLWENVRWVCDLSPHRITNDVIDATLRQFDLFESQHTLVQELSSGQRKRCAIVSLVLSEQPLWLLDEPFAMLDEEGEDLVRGVISSHLQNNGSTVVASHAYRQIDQSQVMELTRP